MEINLTGHWMGKYTYGKGYSRSVTGKSETFEFNIVDKDGSISGSCIDNVVKAIEGNESYIVGTFKNNSLNFKKRYKFHTGIDEKGNLITEHEAKCDGVDYTGSIRKKIFSKAYYFKGKWSITIIFKDYTGQLQTYICTGTWEMEQFV